AARIREPRLLGDVRAVSGNEEPSRVGWPVALRGAPQDSMRICPIASGLIRIPPSYAPTAHARLRTAVPNLIAFVSSTQTLVRIRYGTVDGRSCGSAPAIFFSPHSGSALHLARGFATSRSMRID